MRTIIRRCVDAAYRKSRKTSAGVDPSIDLSAVLSWLHGRAICRIRGQIRGYNSAFIGKYTRIKNNKYLRLGRSVSIGRYVTIDALSIDGIEIGDNCTVDDFAVLRGTGVIRSLGTGIIIGERTSIGAYNVLLGQGGIVVGCDCLLGPNVTILSENHNFDDVERPIRDQGEVRLPTTIGDNVWIGAGVTILGGAVIGDGSVIAAGAVVRGVIDSNSVVGGVPGRVIRMRKG